MISFCIILSLFGAADLFFWRGADLCLRRVPGRRLWRLLLGAFMVVQLSFVLLVFIGAITGRPPVVRPLAWPTLVYIWHILLLPPACFCLVLGWGVGRLRRAGGPARTIGAQPVPADDSPKKLTRREVLGAAAVAVPPLVAIATGGLALADTGSFRIRRVELRIPELPADLDGLTIAQVTDLHIGRFMPAELTGPVADATNALAADLVVFTGDLIDATAPSVSPGIDFIRRLDRRHGLVMIEGNHDVLVDADRFEGAVKDAGLPLLLNEAMTFNVPGRATRVQFLGIPWGVLKRGSDAGYVVSSERRKRFRIPSDAYTAASIEYLASVRQPDQFPILLAHHPHGFDPAAECGFPLVLSGHTHGGQLMLTKNIGVGPLRFRYWSGLYRKPNSQLFISNGIGSWFPLRVNAPPEIVHLTLRRESSGEMEQASR